MSEELVQLREVSKRYQKGKEVVEVLHNLSLDIPSGDFVALMGVSRRSMRRGASRRRIISVMAAITCVAVPAIAAEHIEAINPLTLADGLSVGYSQVTVAKSGRLIFLSGQVGWDTEKKIVGDGSFATQTAKALENVRLALDAAGATPRDVALVRYYIVGLTRERVETMASLVRDSRMWDPESPPVGTVLGVEKLAFDELLIEVEAIAVVPDTPDATLGAPPP